MKFDPTQCAKHEAAIEGIQEDVKEMKSKSNLEINSRDQNFLFSKLEPEYEFIEKLKNYKNENQEP